MEKKIKIESNLGKGFTLIELLAVIVILALLVLVAMPAVTRIIDSSSRNSFKNEVLGIARNMETAYTDKWGKGDIKAESDFDNTKTDIYTITIDGTSYSYLCMTLAQLNSEQYQKKNLGAKYKGYLQMFVSSSTSTTVVNVTNGGYFMQGPTSYLEGHDPEKTKQSTDNYPDVSADATAGCPAKPTAIPTRS